MSGVMTAAVIVMAVALLAGIPAVFAFFSAVLIIALAGGADTAELTYYGFLEMSSVILLAIPLLIFMNAIMTRCGVGERLADYAGAKIMLQINDTENTGKIWTTFLANVSMAGVILPAGLSLILYAFAGGQSIAACFTAAIIPAAILLILFVLVTKIMEYKNLYPQEDAEGKAETEIIEADEMAEAIEAVKGNGEGRENHDDEEENDEEDAGDERSIIPAVIAPVLVLIGIFSGMMTLMEAAAVAVIYIVLIGWLFYRKIDLKDLKAVLIETGGKAGNIMLTLFFAMILSRFFIMEGVPHILLEQLSVISDNSSVLLIFMMLMLIAAGVLTDRISAILLVTPVIVQVAIFSGINPIQFSAVTVLSIGMGCMLISRPTKTNLLFVLLAWLPTLLLTAYVPQISLFLPMVMGYL